MKKLVAVLLSMMLILTGCMALTACKKDDGNTDVVKVVNIKLTDEQYAYAVTKNNATLLNGVNAYLAQIESDGTLDAILAKYFEGTGTKVGAPLGTYDASKDQLVVLTNTPFEPFEYVGDDGQYYGVDMEVAQGLATYLNKELCIIEWTNFDTICEQVNNYDNAIVMAGLTISADRAAIVDFSTAYYEASQVIIAKADDTTFDACTTAADVEAILATFDTTTSIGYQNGTTGALYVNGDADWGFAGIPCTAEGYQTAALATQALINGSIDYVVVDGAPAAAIVAAMNAMN